MKMLFVDPKFYRWGFSYPNSVSAFGPICVATYLKHNGQEAEILDMNARNVGWEELPSIIREKNPNIVGIPSAMNCYVPEALEVAGITKSANLNIVTIGGGMNFTIHKTLIPTPP